MTATPTGPVAGGPAASAIRSSQRAFTDSSWWNTPLADGAPVDPRSSAILDYMRTAPDNGGGYLHLAGGAGGSSWGEPVFWAAPTDQSYAVKATQYPLPPELGSLRIPASAKPAATSDAAMVVYDEAKGYVALLWHVSHDGGVWSAGGGSVAYLDSNGYNARTGRSDDPRNGGSSRGNNGATSFAMYDEVARGSIDHVLKIAIGPEAGQGFVFPMIGSDGNGPSIAPPEGTRLRIKPSVDLTALDLPPQALIIARAAQRYGVYIGDGGGNTSLKLEDTALEGRGQLWDIPGDALAPLPFTDALWQVVAP